MPNHAEQLAQELNLNLKNVQGAIELIDQGNTIPFIARYRKEATGSMDDQVLRNLGDRLEYLRGLDKRKEEVTTSITEQGVMTPELTAALAGIGVQAVLDEPLPPAKHVFTHKIWELGGWRGTAPACALPDGYVWAAPEDLAEVYPVPNAFGAYVKAK